MRVILISFFLNGVSSEYTFTFMLPSSDEYITKIPSKARKDRFCGLEMI